MIRHLLVIILFMSFSMHASSEEACLVVDPKKDVSSLQDLLKVTQKFDSMVQLCWYKKACDNSHEAYALDVPKQDGCNEMSDYANNETRCGLTAVEFQAIKDYSGSYYSCMNRYLRQDLMKSPALDAYIQLLNRALDKLPNYEGAVLRGATLPQNVRDMHKAGNIVTYSSFTSTSTGNGFLGEDQFIIISKTGKPIMGISIFDGENEILFKAGTKFEVLQTFNENGVNFYVMKEVTCGPGSEKEKQEDLALVEKMKTDLYPQTDKWACPELGKSIPKAIQQKNLPFLDLEKHKKYGSMMLSKTQQEVKTQIIQLNEVWNKCTGSACEVIDLKAGPGPSDPKEWYVGNTKKCIWDKDGIECGETNPSYAVILNGKIKQCNALAYKPIDQCPDWDLKKVPTKFEEKEFIAVEGSTGKSLTCTWKETEFSCKDK